MNRESFTFRKEWKSAIAELSPDERLEVYEAVIDYATTGIKPNGMSDASSLAFRFIAADIDQDVQKYTETTKKRSAAGRKHRGNQYTRQEQTDSNSTSATIIPELAPVSSPTQEDTLEQEKERLRLSRAWQESVCMNFKMSIDELIPHIESFFLDCRARGKLSHNNLRDAQSHFNDWLRIKLKQQNENGNNNTSFKAKQQRDKGYAARISQLLAEDQYAQQ